MDNLSFILPEFFISLSIMFLLLLGVYKKNSSNIIHNLAVGSLLITGILIFNNPLDKSVSLFNNGYIMPPRCWSARRFWNAHAWKGTASGPATA